MVFQHFFRVKSVTSIRQLISFRQQAYESLHELRVKFDELPKTAAHIVKMWRTSQQFQDRIVPKVLKFVDGLCEDERLSCA